MDALELVDLARLGSVGSGLRDILQAPIPHQALEHCRAASERANISDAQFRDLRGMLYEVAAHRDAAEQERDAALESARVAREQRLEVSRELRATVREHAVEGVRMRRRVRELERELADARRARTS